MIRGTFNGEEYRAQRSLYPAGHFLEIVIRGHSFRADRLESEITRGEARALAARWLRENQTRWRIPNIARRIPV